MRCNSRCQSHSPWAFNWSPPPAMCTHAAFSWETRSGQEFAKSKIRNRNISYFVKLSQSWQISRCLFNFVRDTGWSLCHGFSVETKYALHQGFSCIRVGKELQWIASGWRLLLGGAGVRQQNRRIARREAELLLDKSSKNHSNPLRFKAMLGNGGGMNFLVVLWGNGCIRVASPDCSEIRVKTVGWSGDNKHKYPIQYQAMSHHTIPIHTIPHQTVLHHTTVHQCPPPYQTSWYCSEIRVRDAGMFMQRNFKPSP